MNAKIRILLAIFLVLLAVVGGVRLWPRPQAPELRLAGWGPDRKTERAEEEPIASSVFRKISCWVVFDVRTRRSTVPSSMMAAVTPAFASLIASRMESCRIAGRLSRTRTRR